MLEVIHVVFEGALAVGQTRQTLSVYRNFNLVPPLRNLEDDASDLRVEMVFNLVVCFSSHLLRKQRPLVAKLLVHFDKQGFLRPVPTQPLEIPRDLSWFGRRTLFALGDSKKLPFIFLFP